MSIVFKHRASLEKIEHKIQIIVRTGKLFFLFFNQNICCGYLKEPSQRDGSFEHPKQMFKSIGKEINAILGAQHPYLDPCYFLIHPFKHMFWVLKEPSH